MERMNVQRKLNLLKTFESYWTMLPYEMQEYILVFKINQEVIDERNKEQNVMLRREIVVHFQLKEKWGLGPIRCKNLQMCNLCRKRRTLYSCQSCSSYQDRRFLL